LLLRLLQSVVDDALDAGDARLDSRQLLLRSPDAGFGVVARRLRALRVVGRLGNLIDALRVVPESCPCRLRGLSLLHLGSNNSPASVAVANSAC
jgi:hypothetical protein